MFSIELVYYRYKLYIGTMIMKNISLQVQDKGTGKQKNAFKIHCKKCQQKSFAIVVSQNYIIRMVLNQKILKISIQSMR